MKMKYIVVLICMLLIATVLPVSGSVMVERTPISTSLGDTLYVGGSGPGNYSTIQEAIDDSTDGDIVFVYDDSAPYYEHIVVNKSIMLVGEVKESTIIDGNANCTVVNITANNVIVTGFTVQNCGVEWHDADIKIHSDYNTISDNIIRNAHELPWSLSCGIMLFFANYNLIERNTIIGNSEYGIHLENSTHTNITRNLITKNRCGIFAWILRNSFFDFQAKITHHIISFNNISNNLVTGLYLHENWVNEIICNNFINNGEAVYVDILGPNTFDGNYWGKPRLLPKMIMLGGWIPSLKVDWHPAQEPYDIGV